MPFRNQSRDSCPGNIKNGSLGQPTGGSEGAKAAVRDLPATGAPSMRHVQSYLLLVGNVEIVKRRSPLLLILSMQALGAPALASGSLLCYRDFSCISVHFRSRKMKYKNALFTYQSLRYVHSHKHTGPTRTCSLAY